MLRLTARVRSARMLIYLHRSIFVRNVGSVWVCCICPALSQSNIGEHSPFGFMKKWWTSEWINVAKASSKIKRFWKLNLAVSNSHVAVWLLQLTTRRFAVWIYRPLGALRLVGSQFCPLTNSQNEKWCTREYIMLTKSSSTMKRFWTVNQVVVVWPRVAWYRSVVLYSYGVTLCFNRPLGASRPAVWLCCTWPRRPVVRR